MKDDYDPCGSIIQGFRRNEFYAIAKYVPVFRGDKLFEQLEIKSIAILKIDVEGGELEVLTGLKAVICETRPFMICEILPVGNEDPDIGMMRRNRTDKIVEMVSSAGYKMFRLLRDGTVVSLDAIESHGDLSLCEYLFVPEELVGAVRKRLEVVTAHS